MGDQMKRLATFMTSMSGILAVLPGINVIANGMAVPTQHQGLFAGSVMATGAFLIAAVAACKKTLSRTNPARVVKAGAIALLTGFLLLAAYLGLAEESLLKVRDKNGESKVLCVPIFPSSELATEMGNLGARKAYDRGPGHFENLVNDQGVRGAVTIFSLLLLYSLTFGSMILALVLVSSVASGRASRVEGDGE